MEIMNEVIKKIHTSLDKEPAGLRSSDIAKQVGVSRVTILSQLKKLEKQGLIIRFDNGPKTWYILTKHQDALFQKGLSFWKIYKNTKLEEHIVLEELQNYLLKKIKLSDQAKSIFGYAFSEMMNNAIEHSRSKRIKVECSVQKKDIICVIEDYGIGAFNNVKTKKRLPNETEAAREILKGKVTTDTTAHTGQGIFFTSRATDRFMIESHSHAIVVENENGNNVRIVELKKKIRGTAVTFFIKINTKLHLTSVFSKYAEADIDGFNTTEIHVNLYANGDHLVSRSQARRIVVGLDKFSKIIFDFSGIAHIGQGFADEIFRVFAKKYSTIEIKPIHMKKEVSFMVRRARAEK